MPLSFHLVAFFIPIKPQLPHVSKRGGWWLIVCNEINANNKIQSTFGNEV